MKTKFFITVIILVLSGTIPVPANNPVITRPTETAYFNAIQIMCGGCANKVRQRLNIEYGIVEVEANPTTKDVKVIYEPERITPEAIKESFKRFDYTVNPLNPNEKNIVSVIFTAPEISPANKQKITDKISSIQGVKDVNLNFRTRAVGIAYNHKLTNIDKLEEALKSIDIDAELYVSEDYE